METAAHSVGVPVVSVQLPAMILERLGEASFITA